MGVSGHALLLYVVVVGFYVLNEGFHEALGLQPGCHMIGYHGVQAEKNACSVHNDFSFMKIFFLYRVVEMLIIK